MATPLTPTQLLATFKAEGITVREYPGWRDRCRCHTGSHEKGEGWAGRGWGTLNGQVTHITAGDLGTRTVTQYIASAILGDPNIPCKVQAVIAPNGELWLVSAGRCNHAGLVGGTVQAHMVAADFSTSDNYDDRFRGSSADGNSFTFGYENITSKTMTAAQYETSVKGNAALARKFGWTGQESVGHGEISSARYYVDPGLDMGKFRRDVMARVKAGPTGAAPAPVPVDPGAETPTVPPVEPTPTPTPVEEPVPVVKLTGLHWNVAGSDTHNGYAAENATRGDDVARHALDIGFEVFTACEAGQDNLRAGMNTVIGNLSPWEQRAKAIWHKPTVTKIVGRKAYPADDIFSYLSTRKWGAAIFGIKDGKKFAVLEIHTDYRSAAKQAKQVASIFRKFRADCDAFGIKHVNQVVCGDFNWDGTATDNPFNSLAAWNFEEKGSRTVATFLTGKHLDGVLAHKDAPVTVTRPDRANSAGVRLSDHFPLRWVIELA